MHTFAVTIIDHKMNITVDNTKRTYIVPLSVSVDACYADMLCQSPGGGSTEDFTETPVNPW